MGNSKNRVAPKDEEVTIDLDIMEISMSIDFSTFPFTNLEYVGDFKWKRKAQTYIRMHRIPFDCNHIDNELIWFLES